MKTLQFLILGFNLAVFCFYPNSSYSQTGQDSTYVDENRLVVVKKHDGVTYVGKILSQDAREVLIETKELGQVVIPKHQIKSIKEIQPGELSSSMEYIGAEVFATRYFISTNGLPIEKGDSYVQWSLFGPDLQFGVGKNFGIGIMTSWLGIPIIGSAKYSIPLSDKLHLGVGTLLGTGSWASPDFGIALPFAALTYGNRTRNLTFSGGYGAVFNDYELTERALFSVAGMVKVSKKITLVFDSFIMPPDGNGSGFALLIPGLRVQTESDKAFQFGFAGMVIEGEAFPLPIPMFQWYRML